MIAGPGVLVPPPLHAGPGTGAYMPAVGPYGAPLAHPAPFAGLSPPLGYMGVPPPVAEEAGEGWDEENAEAEEMAEEHPPTLKSVGRSKSWGQGLFNGIMRLVRSKSGRFEREEKEKENVQGDEVRQEQYESKEWHGETENVEGGKKERRLRRGRSIGNWLGLGGDHGETSFDVEGNGFEVTPIRLPFRLPQYSPFPTPNPPNVPACVRTSILHPSTSRFPPTTLLPAPPRESARMQIPAGWKKWSDPATWPAGKVPGVGMNMGVNATVPCGVGVLLDTNVTLYLLEINGWLKVEALGPLQVMAAFILNQGRVTVGTAAAPYRGRLTVNLTGAANELTITRPPAAPSQPRSVGVRVFATVGGRLELNGMYGNAPSWTTLAATAAAGATSIRVKGDVTAWPVGGVIAIASTDFDRYQAENFTITSVTAGPGNTTVLGLGGALAWMHWGEAVTSGAAGGGSTVDEAAEVALLSRAIVIQGHQNPEDPLIGGHFMVMQTAERQLIKGVELVNMGQQGSLGRYPMHFHLCQDVSGSVVSSCSVHDSNQRCYVVHGTWNLRLEWNLGVNTKGHCFLLEDAIEFGNTFVNNLGFLQEPVKRLLQPTDAIPATQSDDVPSTFWITNPNNTFIGNVAAGSFDSGFWFQLPGRVEGPSALFPNAAGVTPFLIPLGPFVGNAAHSNGRAGLRTYPSGYRPRLNGGVSNVQEKSGINAPQVNITMTSFRAYKNQFIGMFIHNSDGLHIRGARVADNAVVGIELNRDQAVVIADSVFIGESANIGNPTMCDNPSNTFGGCKALASAGVCDLPLPLAKARSNSRTVSRYAPKYGILIDQADPPAHGWSMGVPHRIVNCSFSGYYPRCQPAAGISPNGHSAYIWPATYTSSSLTFPDATSPALYLVPRNRGQLGFDGGYGDAGPLAGTYVWRDEDGSVVGRSGGFAVANNTALLPAGDVCTAKPEWNGYACPGTCYRTVSIQGGSASFTLIPAGGSSNGSSGGVASISSNGAQFVNVLAGRAYVVTPGGGSGSGAAAAAPAAYTVSYADGGFGCTLPVVLQFPLPRAGYTWQLAPSDDIFWQACSGVTLPFATIAQAQWLCLDAAPVLQVSLGANSSATVVLTQVPGNFSCVNIQCGIIPPSANWSYSDTMKYPPEFLAYAPPARWKVGRAPFGYGGQGEVTTVAHAGPGALAWYFRASFSLKYAGCYRSLLFGYKASDGIVVYVNGAEAFRSNMPAASSSTPVTISTPVSGRAPWSTTIVAVSNVRLMSGRNSIMVELHATQAYAWEVHLNMWVAAVGSSCPLTRFFDQRSSLAFTAAAAGIGAGASAGK
ncbi:unnamed protein product [Closterium sp. Naga37s-1]|nr:unnamed protein product [Closterium sp. Naga37s-1]